jgi:hypothetical protein
MNKVGVEAGCVCVGGGAVSKVESDEIRIE